MSTPKFAPWMKVFPIARNEKKPPSGFTDWQHRATNDPAQIEAWATKYPNSNWALACGPSGVGVVDVDGTAGEDSLFDYELEHGALPETLSQKSPRGRHLIFRDPQALLVPSVGKLGAKLDTRGGASYILIAPSTINDVPYVLDNQALADLPAHVRDNAGKRRDAAAAAEGVELDQPLSIMRATELLRGYIERSDVAVAGNGGNDKTYAVSCEVLNLGLSPAKAFEILQLWNDACVPPWSAEELRTLIDHASQYAQNETGCYVVPPARDRIDPAALDKLLAESIITAQEEADSASSGWKFGVHDAEADAALAPITYRDALKLWPDSPGKTVTQVIAPPKCHKTNWIMADLFRLTLDGED
jgi:hypothetical protein